MRWIVLFLPLMVVFSHAFALNMSNTFEPNFSIQILLEDEIFQGVEYTALFKVQNHNYQVSNKTYTVTLGYNLSKISSNGTELIFERINNVSVRKYTTANTGEINVDHSGNFTLCAAINDIYEPDKLVNGTYCSICSLCANLSVIDSRLIPCNATLQIETGKQLYLNKERIGILNNLSEKDYPFEITYWVEDLFGRLVKQPVITKNLNMKSFTPNIESPVEVFVIRSNLTSIACNNNATHVSDSALIIVVNNDTQSDDVEDILESEIVIEEVDAGSDNTARFGDSFVLSMSLMKGDTRKYAVKISSPDKIFEPITLHVPNKNSIISLKIPIFLVRNCNNKYDDGDYQIIVEGLGVSDTTKIRVEGKISANCEASVDKSSDDITTTVRKGTLVYHQKPVFNFSLCQDFEYTVTIENNNAYQNTYQIYGYIYRGSKSYSGDRLANALNITIDSFDKQEVRLKNYLNATSGEYKLKVRVIEEGRKTPYELTSNIFLDECQVASQVTSQNNAPTLNLSSFMSEFSVSPTMISMISKCDSKEYQSEVLYESSSVKASKSVIMIGALCLVLLCMILIWFRTEV